MAQPPSIRPIIYVRGYAGSARERDETTADPFCGFNAGSTVYRAAADGARGVRKFVFESPIVRLAGDFGYRPVYTSGWDIADEDWQPPAEDDGSPGRGLRRESIVIYRYYDGDSTLLGDGAAEAIERYARGLGALVLRVRDLVCARDGSDPAAFRCYLVAHSMGGLIARALLQNPALQPAADGAGPAIGVGDYVDKVFTYGTPHDGIEMAGVDVPQFLSIEEMNSHAELVDANSDRRTIYLSSVFLSNRWRLPGKDSIVYGMTLAVRVPDYEVERRFWPDGHYEGRTLFSDTLIVEMTPPGAAGGAWRVEHRWQGDASAAAGAGAGAESVGYGELSGQPMERRVPFGADTRPGIRGRVLLRAHAWNAA